MVTEIAPINKFILTRNLNLLQPRNMKVEWISTSIQLIAFFMMICGATIPKPFLAAKINVASFLSKTLPT